MAQVSAIWRSVYKSGESDLKQTGMSLLYGGVSTGQERVISNRHVYYVEALVNVRRE